MRLFSVRQQSTKKSRIRESSADKSHDYLRGKSAAAFASISDEVVILSAGVIAAPGDQAIYRAECVHSDGSETG